MNISQSLIDFGTSYFGVFAKPTNEWTIFDKVKAVSVCTFVIPLIIGATTLIGYTVKALTGRVKKDIPPHLESTSLKVSETSNLSGFKKTENKLTTIFVASGGLSQHSPKYQAIIGEKINYNGTKENVHFAHASCTPLAIAFAATASEANGTKAYANENTPVAHLDYFLGNQDRIGRGISRLREMISIPRSGVTLDSLNLVGEDGLKVYNAMMEKECSARRTYNGDPNSYYYFDSTTGAGDMVTDIPNWYRSILKDLKAGEGALIILGGYSIGVRRIEDSYEIFDSHNANSYTGKPGACIIYCPNSDELVKNIDKIRTSGSAAVGAGGQAEAQGVEIYVF